MCRYCCPELCRPTILVNSTITYIPTLEIYRLSLLLSVTAIYRGHVLRVCSDRSPAPLTHSRRHPRLSGPPRGRWRLSLGSLVSPSLPSCTTWALIVRRSSLSPRGAARQRWDSRWLQAPRGTLRTMKYCVASHGDSPAQHAAARRRGGAGRGEWSVRCSDYWGLEEGGTLGWRNGRGVG